MLSLLFFNLCIAMHVAAEGQAPDCHEGNEGNECHEVHQRKWRKCLSLVHMHAGDQAHEGSCQTQEPGLVFYLFSFTLGGCLCICHVFFNSFMFTLFLFVPVLQDHFMSQATKFSDFCFCALEWFQHQLQHPVLLATCAQTMPAIGKYFFFWYVWFCFIMFQGNADCEDHEGHPGQKVYHHVCL